MGVSVSPHICQQHITAVLKDVLGKDVVVYIDDCGIWTDGSFEDHLLLVEKVLSKLADNGFKCNPLKCDWAVKETDFLGFWMTPNSVRPMKTKIDAILKMQRPQTTTQARSLIRAVNFYKSLFFSSRSRPCSSSRFDRWQAFRLGRYKAKGLRLDKSCFSQRLLQSICRSKWTVWDLQWYQQLSSWRGNPTERVPYRVLQQETQFGSDVIQYNWKGNFSNRPLLERVSQNIIRG